MNQQITFTPYEVYTCLMVICGAIVTLSAAIADVSQNERIDALEKKVERFEQLFDNDNKRLIELEKGNRVMQQGMLALLSHALNGNDVDSLKKAKEDLQQYLIGKEI